MKYDFSCDMWSLGCTLYELPPKPAAFPAAYTGRIMFEGKDNTQRDSATVARPFGI